METRVLSVRLPVALVDWIDAYGGERGMSRAVLVALALEGLREDARSGVPDAPLPGQTVLEEAVVRPRAPVVPGRPARRDFVTESEWRAAVADFEGR
jgi:hypothetical protein